MFKGVVSLCLWHFVYLPKNIFFLLDISCQWLFLDIVNVFQKICLQTLESITLSWKNMETYGNMWKHMETYGNMWKHVETYGNMWKHMETYGSTWKHTETYGNYQSVTFPRRFNFTTARGASG